MAQKEHEDECRNRVILKRRAYGTGLQSCAAAPQPADLFACLFTVRMLLVDPLRCTPLGRRDDEPGMEPHDR